MGGMLVAVTRIAEPASEAAAAGRTCSSYREASTAAGDGDGTDAGDGDVSPALGTEEQRLAQQQLDFLNQLE